MGLLVGAEVQASSSRGFGGAAEGVKEMLDAD